MARFNNMAIVTVAGKRQVRVNVSGKSMFFFDLPEWAKHVAIDACGKLFAFERQPIKNPSLASWDSQPGRLSCLGKVGFINNWEAAHIIVNFAQEPISEIIDTFTTPEDKDSGQCKIEDMPVSAKVMAVKDAYENWVDFYYASNRMEIHADSITLLNKQNGFMAEVSFKRGTMVKWEK